jgi:hypothetical protein
MKVKVNFSDLPKGHPVSVHGLGELENGEEYNLDADQVNFWKVMNSVERAPATLILSDSHQTEVQHAEPDTSAQDPQPVVNEIETPADAGNSKKDGK